MRVRRRRSAPEASGISTAVFVLCVVAGSVAVGMLPSVLSLAGALLVCAAGLAALTAVALRLMLRRPPGLEAESEREAVRTPKPAEPADATELRFSRFLFYVGTLTIGLALSRTAGLTISQVFFIAALGGSSLAALRGRAVVVPPPGLVVGVCIFAFGGAISSFNARSPSGSAVEVLHAVYIMLLWAWTAAMVLRTRSQILTAVTLWTISAAANGVGALAQVAGVTVVAGPLEGHRATGFVPHPNDLGGLMGIAIVPALLLATRTAPGERPVVRRLRWVIVVLIAVGLVLAASIAGMVAAMVGLVVWLSAPSVRAPARVAVAAALVVTVAVGVGIGQRVTSPTKRLQLVTSPAGTKPGAGSGEERVSIVKTAWPRIQEDPIVGLGMDAYGKAVTILSDGQPRAYQAHGAPLAAWYEAGIFGLIGILFAFGALAVVGWRSVRASADDDDLLIGLALTAALAGFGVYALAVPFVFQQYAWISVALLVAWRLRRDATPVGVTRQADRGESWRAPPDLVIPGAGAARPGRSARGRRGPWRRRRSETGHETPRLPRTYRGFRA
jgi:O-antigen ligase